MNANTHKPHDFEAAKTRLEQIADAVSDESMPLDEALDLFEEAVALGLQVGDLLEDDIADIDDSKTESAEDVADADAQHSEVAN